jgi:hypothetical protein
MPIPLPNLDDRSFDELTAEARALIPGLQPDWTDHNPSDPGITLVELLAWLTEMLLFQVNQVPEANVEKFLKLLNGPGWTRPEDGDLGAEIRRTVLDLRRRYRAVSAGDFEALAMEADPTVRRVRCLPGRDLSSSDPERRSGAPAHVSVIVLRDRPGDPAVPRSTDEQVYTALHAYLEPRRTLTTRHHVVGPGYVPVEIAANLALRADATPEETLAAARAALAAFLDPLDGGPGGSGWPFGRAVTAGEVYTVLDRVALVDYVEDVQVNGAALVALDGHELPELTGARLTAYDADGVPFEQAATP